MNVKIPPAAKELLPHHILSNFGEWFGLFEEYVIVGTGKAEDSVKFYQNALDRITKDTLMSDYYSRHQEVTYKLKNAEAKVNNLRRSPDQIAIRLSWLEYFKSLSYDQMQLEIERIERKPTIIERLAVVYGRT